MTGTITEAEATAPATGRPDAPTARLLLPADAPAEEWHAARRAGIGGSDVAAILGIDRYRGPLHVYETKHGRGDVRDSEPMKWGRRLEGLIAEAFTEESGLATVNAPGTLVHVDRPWQLANLDKYVIDEDGAVVAPLECKNRSEHQASDWAEEVPDGPALQTHWYMSVGGWGHGWVAALIGGNRLVWHRLERDQELIDHLVEFVGTWWQKHVIEGWPPPPDGSKATTDLLAHLWDVRPEAVVEVDVLHAERLRSAHKELKSKAKTLKEQLDTVENEMRTLTGDAEIARVGDANAWTWKANGTFRSTDFREEQPELAAKYTRMVRAVDTERLAADHPETYRNYRARRLIVPAKGL